MLEQRSFGVFHPPQIPYIYSPPPSSPHPPPRPPTSDLLIDIAHHHFQLPRLLLITISIKNFSHDQIRLHDVLCFKEHRQKRLTSISFQQHRQNIASMAKSMMFQVFGSPYSTMTKVLVFSQKCNSEQLLHTQNILFKFHNLTP